MSDENQKLDDLGIASAATAERLALCSMLEQLEPKDFEVSSLCEGWTVKDVVAHLTLATQETIRDMIVGMVKARGSFDRMTRDTAIARARHFESDALIEQIRVTAGSTRRAPLSSPLDPLLDILVHTQDIARPLGLDYTPKLEHVGPALTHAVNSRWYGGAKRFAEVTLTATDIEWSAGDGRSAVSGPAIELLLMATGRPSGATGL